LRGKKLGIIGFGRIGQSLASYALGCGMEVIAYNREDCTTQIPVKIGGNTVQVQVNGYSDLNKLLSECDYLSLHVPKQKNGEAVLGATEFAAMKKGMRIANASRGGVIDESALLDALASGQVASIALDVYDNEPNPRKELLNHPNIACTPHIGAATL